MGRAPGVPRGRGHQWRRQRQRQSAERLLLAPEGWGGLGAGSVGRVTAQPAWHRLLYLHFRDSRKTSMIFFYLVSREFILVEN